MTEFIKIHFDKDNETILQEKKDLGMETNFYIVDEGEEIHKTFETYEEAKEWAEAAKLTDYEIVED